MTKDPELKQPECETLCENAIDVIRQRYQARLDEHGPSAKALGWYKGRQILRMQTLTSLYDFRGKSVLDIGCGFGDLLKYLPHDITYKGVDLMPDFVEVARSRFTPIKKMEDLSLLQSDLYILNEDYQIRKSPEKHVEFSA